MTKGIFHTNFDCNVNIELYVQFLKSRFLPERLMFLGPDLAAAHFIVSKLITTLLYIIWYFVLCTAKLLYKIRKIRTFYVSQFFHFR